MPGDSKKSCSHISIFTTHRWSGTLNIKETPLNHFFKEQKECKRLYKVDHDLRKPLQSSREGSHLPRYEIGPKHPMKDMKGTVENIIKMVGALMK